MRRLKNGRGISKTRVSPASNSNSFPHSGTGQLARNFSRPVQPQMAVWRPPKSRTSGRWRTSTRCDPPFH